MKKTANQALLADGALLLVAILWGSGFIVNKNVLDYMHPIYILVVRFTLSCLFMGLIFYKKVAQIKLEDLKAGGIIGIFMFIAFLAQNTGLKYTTVSKAAFITVTNVVMVPFIYWYISKERLDTFDTVAAIMCFIGIGFLSLESNFTIGKGEGLVFICAIFFALHIVAIGHYSKKHDPIILTIIQFGVTAILSIIAALVLKLEFQALSTKFTSSILYMVLVSTIVAFGIQNLAQKYTSPTHAAIILSLESVFGTLFSIWLLKEQLTLRLIIGSIIIFLSIITAETKWSFFRRSVKCQSKI